MWGDMIINVLIQNPSSYVPNFKSYLKGNLFNYEKITTLEIFWLYGIYEGHKPNSECVYQWVSMLYSGTPLRYTPLGSNIYPL